MRALEPVRTATSSATACGCTGRSSAPASRRSPCFRRGRSPTRATGSSRCPTSPATTAWSRSTGAAAGRRTVLRAVRAYGYLEYVADTVAVLDATDTDRARARRTLDAVRCGLFRSPSMSRHVSPGSWPRTGHRSWRRCQPTASSVRSASGCRRRDGWAKYNRYYWMEGGYPTSSSSSSAAASRAALDQADRGLLRLGSRDRAGDPRRHRRRLRSGSGAGRFAPSANGSRCPCWSSTATRTRCRPTPMGTALAELTGGRTRRPSPVAGTAYRPATRWSSTGVIKRLHRADGGMTSNRCGHEASTDPSGCSISRPPSGSAMLDVTSPWPRS